MKGRRQAAALNHRAPAVAVQEVKLVEITDLLVNAEPSPADSPDLCSSASFHAGTRPGAPVCQVHKRGGAPAQHRALFDKFHVQPGVGQGRAEAEIPATPPPRITMTDLPVGCMTRLSVVTRV